MFERFTDGARRVVVLAQEDARLLRHHEIGTEHLLLGLARADSGVASRAFAAVGVTLEEARAAVAELHPPGFPPSGPIPFTPGAKAVLEQSLRQAMRRGDDHIGTEHILLALLDVGEGVAARVVERLAGGPAAVRDALLGALDAVPEGVRVDEPTGSIVHLVRPGPGPVFGFPGPAPSAPQPRCAFCGRSEGRVTRLVVARGVLVCDECVREAARLVAEAEREPGAGARLRFRPRVDGPVDQPAATAAIEHAYAAVFGATQLDVDDAVAYVHDGPRFAETLRAMRERAQQLPTANDVTVEGVRFVAGDEAEVLIGIWLAGGAAPMIQHGHAVLVGAMWKVSRETICHLAAMGGVPCPPPED